MTITTQTPDGVMHQFPDGTDPGVIDSAMKSYVSSTPQPQGTAGTDTFGDDLKQAGGSVMNEAGGLLQGAGNAVGSSTIKDAGSWLKTNAPQPSAGYQNRGGQFAQHLMSGDLSTAAGDLAHGAVAGAGNTAGVLGGFALGGPLGAAAAAGLESEGANANKAAGTGEVQGKDLLTAAPEAATDAAITGATTAFMPSGSGLINGLKRSALMGASGAGQSAADQAIETGKVDPSQVLNAGATGAASTALVDAPNVARGATGEALTNAASRNYQPANDLEAYSWQRVGQSMDARQQDAAQAGKPVTQFQVANNLKSEWGTDLDNLVTELRKRGADRDDLTTLKALKNAALRNNNTLDFANDGLFNRIDDMDLPDMGGVTKEDIKNTLLDLNTISGQSFLKNGTGPLQQAGALVGRYGAMVHGALTGNPMEAILGGITGHSPLGNIGARAGGAIGALGDRVMGSNVPPATMQRMAAQRYLQQRGLAAPDRGSLGNMGDYTPPQKATPTPGFIRPNSNNTINPAAPSTPTPGFIQPNAGNTINPAVPGTPTPGFIQPNAGNTIQTASAPAEPSTPTPGFIRPNAGNTIRAAVPQPDPVTGNRPDPVPVNTPTRLGPSGGAPLPPLRVNTPGDVAQAVQADDGVSSAGQAQSLQAGLTAAARAMPAAHPSSPTWERFAANGDPTVTRGQVRDAAASVFSPEAIQALDHSTSVANAAQVLGPVQRKLQQDAQARQVGLDPNATKGVGQDFDAQGRPIRSRAAYDNGAQGYQSTKGQLAIQGMSSATQAGASPQEALDVSAAIHRIGDTKGRQAKMEQAMAEIGKLPPAIADTVRSLLFHKSLLDHGPA